jgi:hypothetical protein
MIQLNSTMIQKHPGGCLAQVWTKLIELICCQKSWNQDPRCSLYVKPPNQWPICTIHSPNQSNCRVELPQIKFPSDFCLCAWGNSCSLPFLSSLNGCFKCMMWDRSSVRKSREGAKTYSQCFPTLPFACEKKILLQSCFLRADL